MPLQVHPAAGPRRRPAAGAAARGRPMLCWRPLVGPPRTACSTIAVSSSPRPLRGWLAKLAGLSLAPAGGRSCVPRSFHRPPTSEPRTTSCCGPAHASFGYAACLRRSATRSAAPSMVTVHGCGCPVRVSGDTSVASQHNAPPCGVAPYTTRSSLDGLQLQRSGL